MGLEEIVVAGVGSFFLGAFAGKKLVVNDELQELRKSLERHVNRSFLSSAFLEKFPAKYSQMQGKIILASAITFSSVHLLASPDFYTVAIGAAAALGTYLGQKTGRSIRRKSISAAEHKTLEIQLEAVRTSWSESQEQMRRTMKDALVVVNHLFIKGRKVEELADWYGRMGEGYCYAKLCNLVVEAVQQRPAGDILSMDLRSFQEKPQLRALIVYDEGIVAVDADNKSYQKRDGLVAFTARGKVVSSTPWDQSVPSLVDLLQKHQGSYLVYAPFPLPDLLPTFANYVSEHIAENLGKLEGVTVH